MFTSQIEKEKANTASGLCWFVPGIQMTNLDHGYCQRYACANGHYYEFSGWTWKDCVWNGFNPTNPLCPTNSCEPMQGI